MHDSRKKKSRCDHCGRLLGVLFAIISSQVGQRATRHRDTAWVASRAALLKPQRSIIDSTFRSEDLFEGARLWLVLMTS